MRNSPAILPAAQCLFDKKKVTVAELVGVWTEGSVVVCRKPNDQLYFIAGSCGSYYEVGTRIYPRHDQTGSQFDRGEGWAGVNTLDYKNTDSGVEITPKDPANQIGMAEKAGMAVFK